MFGGVCGGCVEGKKESLCASGRGVDAGGEVKGGLLCMCWSAREEVMCVGR